jgi:hypothetical protein
VTDPTRARRIVDPATKAGYELAFEDEFPDHGEAEPARPDPREFVVDSFRAWSRRSP